MIIQSKKIALLVDVDNVRIGGEAFNELYSKLCELGDVVYCKFYGYNDRKHIYLSDAIAKYGYETAPFMRFKKRFSQLDIRLVVDAIKLNYTKPEIDTFCIVAGDGDLIPALVELKSCGKTLIDVNTLYQELNYHMFDAHINLMSLSKTVEVYVPKTRKKPVAKTSDDESETSSSTKKSIKRTTSKREEIVGQPAREVEQVKEDVYDNDFEDEEQEDNGIDNDALSEALRDITTRYGELDFSNDSDMDKKVQLIRDIELLIETETSKGEGLESSNADVRQIFVELQNIVDDMKNAI